MPTAAKSPIVTPCFHSPGAISQNRTGRHAISNAVASRKRGATV